MNTNYRRALKTTLKANVVAGLLAGASSAFAQSSVQLYGQVDEWAARRNSRTVKAQQRCPAAACLRPTGV